MQVSTAKKPIWGRGPVRALLQAGVDAAVGLLRNLRVPFHEALPAVQRKHLVDDRAADYAHLDVLALLADNSWNGGIVLSEFVAQWPDLAEVLGKATRDGAAVGEGHGRDILGHPFNSVAWLAAHLATRGERLQAGQIVMTGSVMKTVFPNEDATYAFSLDRIGDVSVVVR